VISLNEEFNGELKVVQTGSKSYLETKVKAFEKEVSKAFNSKKNLKTSEIVPF
jgi:hypothetical protein